MWKVSPKFTCFFRTCLNEVNFLQRHICCRETINQDINKLSNNEDDSDFFHGDFLEAISSSENRQTSSTSSKDSQVNEDCGVVTIGANPLITNGQDTRPGNFLMLYTKGLSDFTGCH